MVQKKGQELRTTVRLHGMCLLQARLVVCTCVANSKYMSVAI